MSARVIRCQTNGFPKIAQRGLWLARDFVGSRAQVEIVFPLQVNLSRGFELYCYFRIRNRAHMIAQFRVSIEIIRQ